MPTYRVHFAELPYEPFPPLKTLPEVEADDPLFAAEQLVISGRVPQDRHVKWCRVIVSVHPNGQAKTVRRFPIEPTREIPVDWRPPTVADDE